MHNRITVFDSLLLSGPCENPLYSGADEHRGLLCSSNCAYSVFLCIQVQRRGATACTVRTLKQQRNHECLKLYNTTLFKDLFKKNKVYFLANSL